MSHEIDQMAYVGEMPWHELGNPLTEGQPLSVWQTQAGLDWSVQSTPVEFLGRTMPSRKVLYRDDTFAALSVVGKDYKPVQPIEVLEFYRDLVADFGFVLETAGSLKGGQKVWALARTGDSAFVKASDELRGYLLLATSYDGAFATTAQFTSVRVVCNNTLGMSLRANESGAIKIGHRTKFNEVEVKALLGLSREAFDMFIAATRQLSEISLTAEKAAAFYKTIVEDPKLQGRFATTFAEHGYAGAEDTAWGAVNVVTEYLDHVRRQSKPGGRLDSAWFGGGAAMKQRALTAALELV